MKMDKKRKRRNPNITAQEIQELWDLGYSIHASYIGVVEGTEFWFMPNGEWDRHIYGGKSARAAYNKCKQWISKGTKPKYQKPFA